MDREDLLPNDARKHHIYPQLDPLTRIVIRFVLFYEIPEKFSPELQKEVLRYSRPYFEFFFQSLIDPLSVPQYEAAHGNIPVLEWAYEKGCPQNADVCAEAVRGGHLETLEGLA